jgi:CheY-like chemotaxis protein
MVLVVDDEPLFLRWLRHVLTRLNYKTIVCIDIKHVDQVLQSGRRIDLLITDVALIGSTGRAVADLVRKHQDVPVIFVSGYDNLMVGEPVLLKPFTDAQLQERISEKLGRSRFAP